MTSPYPANDDDEGPARARRVIYIVSLLVTLAAVAVIWGLLKS